MEDYWHPSTSSAHLAKRVWVHGFIVGLGVVAAIFLVWVLVRSIHVPLGPQDSAATISLSQTHQDSQIGTVPRVTGTSSPLANTTAVLETQVEKVLARIKEANQKKDLSQLLTLYSPTFPELRMKVQEISRSWVTCNYPKMDFLVQEVKLLSDARVFARVIWHIQVEDLQTKKLRKVSRIYLVWFTNESGEWRIQALKKAG
jgi:hypothetical protein